LYAIASPKNGTVVDLTVGSGSGAIAAIQEGRRYIGLEQDLQSLFVRFLAVLLFFEQNLHSR
jgi:DNA modification methylase